MVLATILTVVLSVSFRSVTETQITKLEEENQKALAAAEAAIDALLKSTSNTVTLGQAGTDLASITGFTGGASLTTTTATSFITPALPQDASYTFYLGDYNPSTHQILASEARNIDICFKSASTNPALEITLVKTSGLKKYVVDPDARITNASSPSIILPSICSDNSYNYTYPIPAADIGLDAKVLLVRTLYRGGRLLFYRSTNLPLQGKTISSSAVSQTGVSKKITLFQSYPQIPAEFFTTAF